MVYERQSRPHSLTEAERQEALVRLASLPRWLARQFLTRKCGGPGPLVERLLDDWEGVAAVEMVEYVRKFKGGDPEMIKAGACRHVPMRLGQTWRRRRQVELGLTQQDEGLLEAVAAAEEEKAARDKGRPPRPAPTRPEMVPLDEDAAERLADPRPSPDEEAEGAEEFLDRRDSVRQALVRLPERERSLAVWALCSGRSVSAWGAANGLTPVQAHRLLQVVKDRLGAGLAALARR